MLAFGGGGLTCNVARTADVGEAGDIAKSLPAVLGDEAVGTIAAGDAGELAAAVVVDGVVFDGCGRGEADGGEDGGCGELHFEILNCCCCREIESIGPGSAAGFDADVADVS